jgi:hypothetical protein
VEIALLYLTRWWCVLAEVDMGGDVTLCFLQGVEEAWLFSVYGVLRNVRYQNDALPLRGDVRMSMREVELTVKLLTGHEYAFWMTSSTFIVSILGIPGH